MAWILRALELYKSFVRPQDTCPMENLAPSKVRDLLHEVLRETAIGTGTPVVDPDPTGHFFYINKIPEMEFLKGTFS
jgi:hypothetical protein